MEKLTKRQLYILYYFIEKDKCTTAEVLANFSCASVRTIRSEITVLNKSLMEQDILTIRSNPAKGYQVEILNQEAYNMFSQRVVSEFNFFKLDGVEKMSRRFYILQRLLSDQYVKTEDLAMELYLTKSAIKDDIAWAVHLLESYDIKVSSKAGKGSMIQGKEEDIRSVMVETFCSQYYDLPSMYEVAKFKDAFYTNFNFYQDIRHALLKILRTSSYSMKDISTKKISTYILLSKNRIAQGCIVLIPEHTKKELKGSYELILAYELYCIPDLCVKELIPEEEIYYLAMLLMYHRDVNLMEKNEFETIHKQFLSETVNGYEKIISSLRNDCVCAFFRMELIDRYQDAILSSLFTMYVGAKYHFNKQIQLTTYYELTDYELSPIAIHLAREFLQTAQIVFKTEVNTNFMNRYIVLFDLIFKRVNFDYKKRRIALISLAGRVVAHEYKEYILDRFTKFIQYIHVFNQYEMRRINFSDYDLVLIDSVNLANTYPIPFVSYYLSSFENTTFQLFEGAFMEGYSKEMVDYLSQITTTYDDFVCSGYEILFKMLSFKYAANNSNEFEQMLTLQENIYSFYRHNSMVAMIFCDYTLTKKEFVDIYRSNQKMMWDKNNELKYILVISLPKDLAMEKCKSVNKILTALYQYTTLCEELFVNTKETYKMIFADIIRNHFLHK